MPKKTEEKPKKKAPKKGTWGGPGRGGGRKPKDPAVGKLAWICGGVRPETVQLIDAEVAAGRVGSRSEFVGAAVEEKAARLKKEGA